MRINYTTYLCVVYQLFFSQGELKTSLDRASRSRKWTTVGAQHTRYSGRQPKASELIDFPTVILHVYEDAETTSGSECGPGFRRILLIARILSTRATWPL